MIDDKRPNIVSNRHAPACFWAEAQVPYVPPGQGGEQEQYVDFKTSRKGDRVKVAQAWVGHFPTLCKVEGTLTNRAGRSWAVLFDGSSNEMLFNVEPDMRQLAVVSRALEEQSAGNSAKSHKEHVSSVEGEHMAGAVLAMQTGASD